MRILTDLKQLYAVLFHSITFVCTRHEQKENEQKKFGEEMY